MLYSQYVCLLFQDGVLLKTLLGFCLAFRVLGWALPIWDRPGRLDCLCFQQGLFQAGGRDTAPYF